MPNPEVKPAIAESTAESVRGRIGRRARGGCFCFLQAPGPDDGPGACLRWGVSGDARLLGNLLLRLLHYGNAYAKMPGTAKEEHAGDAQHTYR